MARRTRTPVDPMVRAFIGQEARDDREASARVIRGRVRRRLQLWGPKDKPLPKDRAIQAIAKRAREAPGPSPDDPWSLGVSPPEIPADATADLLAVWKVSLEAGWRLTIRQARWVARLRSVMPAGNANMLFAWSIFYDRAERIAIGRGDVPETIGLDAELAFRSWESELHLWEYDQAGSAGAVPEPVRGELMRLTESLETAQGQVTGAFSGSEPDASEFLFEALGIDPEITEEVTYDPTYEPWWPHAESVMVFWLRALKKKLKKWELVGEVGEDDEEDDQAVAQVMQEWRATGLKLAELVVAKAKEIAAGGYGYDLEDDGKGGWWRVAWEPTAVLQEAGYYDSDRA